MSERNITPGGPVPLSEARRRAKEVVKGLMYFAIMRSTDPKKQKVLDELQELRCKVQDVFEILAPGYLEE